MIKGKFIGSGTEGIIYRCDDGSALKVFYREYSSKKAEDEIYRANLILQNSINVPKPFEIIEVVLEAEDLKDIKKLRTIGYGFTSGPYSTTICPGSLTGKKCYAIRREYIEGMPLDKRFFPSSHIRKKVDAFHQSLENVGLILTDRTAGNLIITPNNEIYTIDYSGIHKKSELKNISKIMMWIHTSTIMTPACRLEDIASTIIQNILSPCIY